MDERKRRAAWWGDPPSAHPKTKAVHPVYGMELPREDVREEQARR